MGKHDPRIDEYIDNKVADFAKPVLLHLRELIHAACPDVEETWKWSFPHFMYNGAILCSMAAFKQHAVFGFWKATLMPDPDNILTTHVRTSMGHMGRLTGLNDLPKDSILKKYIREAMKLNDEGVKLPPKKKVATAEKKELVIPDALLSELKKNKAAEKVFNDFSYSHRKEYVEWITEAKTDVTRNKRIAQAIEMMAEGKGRHWKYAAK